MRRHSKSQTLRFENLRPVYGAAKPEFSGWCITMSAAVCHGDCPIKVSFAVLYTLIPAATHRVLQVNLLHPIEHARWHPECVTDIVRVLHKQEQCRLQSNTSQALVGHEPCVGCNGG
jgi:hypothetical protein